MRGGFGNGFGGVPMIGPAQQPQAIQVATPMNDVQLLATLAVQMQTSLPVKEAVERAGAIVAEAMRYLPTFNAQLRAVQNEQR